MQILLQTHIVHVDKELPLTDPFFAMEDKSNINDRVLPTPLAQKSKTSPAEHPACP